MTEFTNVQQHKARKRYVCHLCGSAILPGAEYVYEASKWDGELHQMRRHIHCDAILNAYCDKEEVCEYTESEVLEWACDNACAGCRHANEDGVCEDGGTDAVFVCEIAQEKLLPPQYLEAAKKSVVDNDESLEG